MAHTTGTATDHTDFFNTLISFLKTDAGLVAANENWTEAWAAPGGAPNSTDVVLQGPGLSDSDEVYIGLRLIADAGAGHYEIHMVGMTGIDAAATEFDAHVNVTPVTVRMFLDNAAMTYWFSANGRRFMAAAKISTVYEALYAGLVLPYAQPAEYPYPLFIGGTNAVGNASVDWRSTSADHTMFYAPVYDSGAGIESNAWFLSPSGAWLRCGQNGDIAVAPNSFGIQDFGIGTDFTVDRYGYEDIKDRVEPAYGGSYILTPLSLLQSDPANQTFGILHGAFHVGGRGNAAENTVTVVGTSHLVLQNVFRTDIGGYAAIALEDS